MSGEHEDARAERAVLSHAEAYRLVAEAREQRERAEKAEKNCERLRFYGDNWRASAEWTGQEIVRLTAGRDAAIVRADGLSLALQECREALDAPLSKTLARYREIEDDAAEPHEPFPGRMEVAVYLRMDVLRRVVAILAQPPESRGAALLARLQAAEAVCKAMEACEHGPACQECGECSGCGHEPDCSIGAALAAYREATTATGGETGR